MRDRWFTIPHIYHLSITRQVQVECPKSVLLFGHSMPRQWAMNAQAEGTSTSLPLTHRKSAISELQQGCLILLYRLSCLCSRPKRMRH